MKLYITISLLAIALTGCAPKKENALFSGRVEYFYYLDEHDGISGFTRFDQGLPGTSTRAKEDVWLDIYPNWVVARLKNRKDESYIVPRERVRHIIVGTKETNELNAPK